MTNQELFTNTYRHHVLEKNPPGYDPIAMQCCYRSPDGARCAIGCSLPESFNASDFDGKTASSLIEGEEDFLELKLPSDAECTTHKTDEALAAMRESRAAVHAFLLGTDPRFADRLQRLHDAYATRSTFHAQYAAALTALASELNLTVPSE